MLEGFKYIIPMSLDLDDVEIDMDVKNPAEIEMAIEKDYDIEMVVHLIYGGFDPQSAIVGIAVAGIAIAGYVWS